MSISTFFSSQRKLAQVSYIGTCRGGPHDGQRMAYWRRRRRSPSAKACRPQHREASHVRRVQLAFLTARQPLFAETNSVPPSAVRLRVQPSLIRVRQYARAPKRSARKTLPAQLAKHGSHSEASFAVLHTRWLSLAS